MITARNLTKVYHKGGESIVVLDHVDLSIGAGEFIMIMGESGTGKTTLLNFLGALDRPDNGEIIVGSLGNVLKINDKALSTYRNKIIGHVFQTFNLKPTYTAFENVRVPLLLTRMKHAEQKGHIEEALRAVGLWGRKSFRPIELSEGQCQRVAIARAIVNKPSILLADEPTGNLDPKTARSIMGLLTELNQKMNMTLVMVTHDLEVIKHADRVLTLAGGKLVENGTEYGYTKTRDDLNRRIT